MINILACLVFPYGHAEFMYFDSENLPRFGMKIFENLIFASNNTICTSNESSNNTELKFEIKKFFLLKNFGKKGKKNFFFDP